MSVSNEEMAAAILKLQQRIKLLEKLDDTNDEVVANLHELLDIKDKRIARLEKLIEDLTS